MHLLEALLAAYASFGEVEYLQNAREVIDLFLDRLFQRQEGALPEYFHEELSPLRHENGQYIVEPGHHYEWVWLLDLYAKSASPVSPQLRRDLELVSNALLDFANQFALDRTTGLVVNQLWSDGTVRSGDFRVWPQTERLKALAGRRGFADKHAPAALTALFKHLDGVRAGLWHERIGADGVPTNEPAPATSLYHLTAALTHPAVLAFANHR
jgi:mannose-6-phosphate isomerase